MYNRKKYGLIVLAVVLVIAVVAGGYTFLSRDIWLTQPYINSIPNIYDGKSDISYDDETGIYTITKPAGDFKILQLTDIHLGGGVLSYDKDMKALEAVYELLDRTRPDLVIVTGDLVFRGRSPMGTMILKAMQLPRQVILMNCTKDCHGRRARHFCTLMFSRT